MVAVDRGTRQVTCANVGDSSALLVLPGRALPLTTDHRLENNAEECVSSLTPLSPPIHPPVHAPYPTRPHTPLLPSVCTGRPPSPLPTPVPIPTPIPVPQSPAGASAYSGAVPRSRVPSTRVVAQRGRCVAFRVYEQHTFLPRPHLAAHCSLLTYSSHAILY